MNNSIKQLLLIAVLCMRCIIPAFAQHIRHCDIQLRLIAPKNNSVYNPDTFGNIIFSLKNFGPDTITTYDTLFLKYIYDNTAHDALHFGSYLKPNDSIIMQDLLIPGPGGFNNTTHKGTFCVTGYMNDTFDHYNPNRIIDPNFSNNIDCDSVFVFKLGVKRLSPLSVLSDVSLSPNPARDQATLTYTLAALTEVSCQVYDMAGRLVYSSAPRREESGERQLPINTASLPAGIYLVKTRFGEEVKTGRLAVMH